jgi:16S rRNA (cytidine1402-2'-O)-methyltransferase
MLGDGSLDCQGVAQWPGRIMAGRLFVVATPLGNLEDLSARARRTLREVALIACEDTRRTARLLAGDEVRVPLTSLFEHNEREKCEHILEALRGGKDVALVSDAGTPAISDPGYRLVRAARDEGLPVIPVPGPSAVTAALSVSGLPSDRFLFVGFLPARRTARRRALAELAEERATLVLYESPLRVVECLADLFDCLGEREAFLCREATKLHEEYLRAPLSALRALLLAREVVRGEVVLVVEGRRGGGGAGGAETAEDVYAQLVAQGRTRREAVKETARRLGLPAREVYRRVLEASPDGS